MNRALCIAGLLIAAPVAADESTFPNKPWKKPEARIVIGVQSGATTAPPPDIVVGAGSGAAKTGTGDFGLIAPTPLRPSTPKRSVGYDPAARFANKRPTS